MKKLLLLLMVASVGIAGTATAQKKSKDHHKKYRKYDRRDDDDRNWQNQNGNYNGQYSNNAPRKVRDAFYRDYPNASNVRWTKDRGVWTASFRGGGVFGGSNSVSYRANGQRVGYNDGIYRERDRTATTNYPRRSTNDGRTTDNNNTRIWDKIKKRQ